MSTMPRPFLICIHDATPAFARETERLLRDLEPLVGRRISLGVVPDWRGEWSLSAHPGYCRMIAAAAGELLLHGCCHHRRDGGGPVTWLAERSDEMSGLDREQTRRTIESAQAIFSDAFGARARGFLPPAWQRGRVYRGPGQSFGLDYVMDFFSVESRADERIPLATSSWDCGRWGWLGHVGDGVGWALRAADRGVPVVAIHPRDLARGFWPRILRLTGSLLASGYQPATPAGMLERHHAAIAA